MQENRTITIIHDTRYDRGDGKYPLKLRITFKLPREGKSKWVQKYITSDHYLTVDEFKTLATTKDSILRSVRKDMEELKAKAESIKGYMTPESFMSTFTGSGNMNNVIDFMKMLKKQYYEADQVGMGHSFRDAISSFSDFVNPTRKRARKQEDEESVWLSFIEIDEDWLKRYEAWAKKRGNKINTIGIYLRNLRIAFNTAKSKKHRIISPDIYPFGSDGYVIKKQKKTKWAPEEAEKKSLLAYQSDDKKVLWALDMGKFSYYMNGSNPADIAHLKAGVFLSGNDSFELDRRKTENTEINKELIQVHIHPEMRAIWQRHGNKTLNPDEYAFPIITAGLTAIQQRNKIVDFIKDVNECLDVVGKDIGLKKKLTFGIFRHIFSTTLSRKGVALTDRQKALGHDSPETTQNYDHSFNQDKAKELSGYL